MEAEIAEGKRQIAKLEAEIAAGQRYLQAIHDSPSLRLGKALTWPARKLRSMFRSK
jgi:hypothetical protein